MKTTPALKPGEQDDSPVVEAAEGEAPEGGIEDGRSAASPSEPTQSADDDGASDGQIRTGRLAGLSLPKAMWVLSWPILTQAFLDSTVGLVDVGLASRLGEPATDAVGSASYFMWFVGMIVMSVGIGATALISRAVGGANRSLANKSLGQAIMLAVVLGTLAGIGFALFAPVAGRALSLDSEASLHMRNYMWAMGVGLPMTAVTFMGIACLRGSGDSIRPLWIMVFVNLVNIPMSWYLSGVLITGTLGDTTLNLQAPGSPGWGVVGIGIGTGVARTVGAILITWTLWRGQKAMRLHVHRLMPDPAAMRRLIRIGFPNLLESMGMWFGNYIIFLIIAHIVQVRAGGSGIIGSHMVAIRIEAFSFLPGFAMGTAAATLVGQYLGAGNPREAKRAVVLCATVAGAIMGLFGYAFLFHNEAIVRLISNQPTHHEVAPYLLWIAGWIQIPFGVMLVIRNALRGAGDTKVVAYITWVAVYGIRVVGCVLAATMFPEHGLAGLWYVMCGEIVIRAVVFLGRFLHGGWTRIKV